MVNLTKTICIAATQRSGSNLLCAYMRGLGVLGRPDEHLNPEVTRYHHPEWDGSIVSQLNYAIPKSTPNGVFAIKLFRDEWDNLCKEADPEEWLPNRTWLWMRRLDSLAQAISFDIAEQTSQWTSLHEANGSSPVYSPAAIDEKMLIIKTSDKRWHEFFEANNIEPLVLWYEGLVQYPERFLTAICKHADIPMPELWPPRVRRLASRFGCQLPGEPDVPLKRQHSEVNEEWKRRYIEALHHDLKQRLLQEQFADSQTS